MKNRHFCCTEIFSISSRLDFTKKVEAIPKPIGDTKSLLLRSIGIIHFSLIGPRQNDREPFKSACELKTSIFFYFLLLRDFKLQFSAPFPA